MRGGEGTGEGRGLEGPMPVEEEAGGGSVGYRESAEEELGGRGELLA